MAFKEGIVGSVMDARRRFLAEGGRVVPRSLELMVALVECTDDYADLDRWGHPFYQMDFSPLRSLAVNTPLPIGFSEQSLVSEVRPILRVDLTSAGDVDLEGRVKLGARRSVVAHGLGCWFSSELSPGLVLSNRPPNRVPSWDQVLSPFEAPHPLEAGDVVEVQIRCSDNGRDWQWQTETTAAEGSGGQTRQSSAQLHLPDSALGRRPEQPSG